MGTSSTPIEPFDDVRVAWKLTTAMYFAGAATLYAVLPVPEPDPSDHVELAAIATVLLVCGVAFWLAGPRRDLVKLSAISGVVTVSAIVAVSRPVGASPFFYLWPVLLCGYILSRRELYAALGLLVVGFGVAMLLSAEPHTKAVIWVGGSSSFVLAGLVVNQLRRRLGDAMAQLERSAATDPLTGLLNRRGFAHAFDRDLERARRMGLPLSLVIIDLDHFKQVNDRFGHAVGDAALAAIARVMLDERRGGDAVARTGGEEFAVVLLDSDLDGALAYARRVAAAARLDAGPAGPLGLSAGIVALGEGAHTREDLMLAGDRLLYAAKAAGRGRAAVQGDPARMERLDVVEPLTA